jgi:hypothetical protein
VEVAWKDRSVCRLCMDSVERDGAVLDAVRDIEEMCVTRTCS